MGASFTCLVSRQHSRGEDYGSSIATLSPVSSLRRRSRSSSEQSAVGTLQDVAIDAVATAVTKGNIGTKHLVVLPIDLLQRVVDRLVEQDALTLDLLQGVISPWLHRLHLQGLAGVDDSWMPVLAGARHCTSLDLSGAAVGDSGLSWLPWLWGLCELRLQHCSSITDAALAQVCGLTRLRVLDVEGCEGLTAACLTSVAPLTALTHINMGQCAALKGNKLNHIAGLRDLQHLSLGWCRVLGDVVSDPANSIAPLASLSNLTHLNLGGTLVGDRQLRQVLKNLTALQELDVSRSPVTASCLGGLPSLTHSLRVLKIRGGQVCDAAGAPALAALTSLRVLDLSCSSISDRGLMGLAALQDLTTLLLDMCRVGDEACRVFRVLTSLELLDLSDTLVSDEGAAHLCRCRRMSWLALCNTDCGDKTAMSLACMPRLTHLNLDGRGVTDNCLAMMLPVGLTLRALDMSGGRITSRGAALLSGGYTQLTSLDLCGGHITDRACHELCKLPELRQLNLSQNRSLSDGGVRVLAGGLKEVLLGLNISYTSVTDASMTTLASMKVLEVVVLSYSCVSEAGAQRLRAARPLLAVKATRRKTPTGP